MSKHYLLSHQQLDHFLKKFLDRQIIIKQKNDASIVQERDAST
jgi:hypothetical protein